jgi:hypothetical protein
MRAKIRCTVRSFSSIAYAVNGGGQLRISHERKSQIVSLHRDPLRRLGDLRLPLAEDCGTPICECLYGSEHRITRSVVICRQFRRGMYDPRREQNAVSCLYIYPSSVF